jgi:hypothetical protein
MVLEETSGETIRMEISAAPDGKIRRVFTVDGKARPYNREGRVWMAKTLPLFTTFLGPRREGLTRPHRHPHLEEVGKP